MAFCGRREFNIQVLSFDRCSHRNFMKLPSIVFVFGRSSLRLSPKGMSAVSVSFCQLRPREARGLPLPCRFKRNRIKSNQEIRKGRISMLRQFINRPSFCLWFFPLKKTKVLGGTKAFVERHEEMTDYLRACMCNVLKYVLKLHIQPFLLGHACVICFTKHT